MADNVCVQVMVDAWCAGYFTEADGPERRLAWPLIFLRRGSPSDNGYACPVEGIHITVDLGKSEVVHFEDAVMVPLPPPDPLRNYAVKDTPLMRSDIKPLVITQPEGPR